MNDQTAATPETVPVEKNLDAIIDGIEAELDAVEAAPDADEPEAGDAPEAPALEGEEATDEAEQPVGEATPPPATVKVKVNGEDREVSLDEALKGYSRTEDYKAKTEQLANDRRAVESHYAEQLNAVAQQMQTFDPVLAEAQSIDWAQLAQEDPAAYVAKKAAVEQRQQYIGAVQAEVARIEREQLNATVAQETARLEAAIPQLADPATAPGYMGDLIGYAKKVGFDEDTIRSITDHRFYVIADKARQFDALQAAKKAIPARKVTPVATVKAARTGSEAPRPATLKIRPGMSDDQRADVLARRLME